MIEATAATADEFLHTQVGRTVKILAEREIENGVFEGYTENYTPAKIRGYELNGQIISAKVTGVADGFAICEPEE
jgi:threonylcarbamoyladenosine tRNA methylthiotransferase MtaB